MEPASLYPYFLAHPAISTDTRNIQPNSLFFALKGENFNGNAFAAEAIEKGARYAVIDEPQYQTDERFLLVTDVLTALQELARHHRYQLRIPIVGITGTNGKTTTKELIHAVLSQQFNTLATIGNLNNHIGVPLTMLAITQQTEIAIIEMGANHVGEIALLCGIAQPTHGLITNVGKPTWKDSAVSRALRKPRVNCMIILLPIMAPYFCKMTIHYSTKWLLPVGYRR